MKKSVCQATKIDHVYESTMQTTMDKLKKCTMPFFVIRVVLDLGMRIKNRKE